MSRSTQGNHFCTAYKGPVIDKLHDNRSTGSEESAKGFYYIWAWPPSWLCELDNLIELSFPLPRRLLMALIG